MKGVLNVAEWNWVLATLMRSDFSSTDSVDACVHGDISGDAADYEAESWSLVVEHKFCKKQDKRAVKRQDVIYGKEMLELWNKTTGMCHFLTQSFV